MKGFLRKYNIFTRTTPYAKDFYVLSSSSSLYGELSAQLTPDYDGKSRLVSSIAEALDQCVADRGDVIHVLPGHAETITAAITVDVAGVSIVGEGTGSLRPTITVNGTVDGIDVTAANVTISGLHFAAPETDNATAMINVGAAGVTLSDISGIGSQTAKNFVDGITVAAAGNDLVIDGFKLYNTVVDVVAGISIEGAAARVVIRNCVIQGTFSTACIMDEATATLTLIEKNVLKNTKAATAVVTFTTGNSTGVMRDNDLAGRHTTIASNLVTGTGMDFFRNYVTEEASVSGLLLPAVDAD